ncbi:hypothetical protein AGOR_G00172240 [Albula goreensis]|uniref:AB hydrolase-1 domain-containing protein n=1 Tax=Albula goreensis TaxID=1534307 RepID=A0A8T3CYG4_9TELE|nr:hypothetical protein AGOR_G00172240 [Albula goreensis]
MQDETKTESSGWGWLPSWRPTSMSLLKSTEAKILSCIQNDLWARFVTLPTQDRIWTLTVTNKNLRKAPDKAARTPLNLDPLCRSRPLLAFDLLGFGRSSRPWFPPDPAQAEQRFLDSIEHWRRALGLDRMILLGHSLGGYLATSYAIQYPERVRHLILVDPWGFPERPQALGEGSEGSEVKRPAPPRWVKAVASVVTMFNPLAVIRAAGPWGKSWGRLIKGDKGHVRVNK